MYVNIRNTITIIVAPLSTHTHSEVNLALTHIMRSTLYVATSRKKTYQVSERSAAHHRYLQITPWVANMTIF